MLTTRINFFGAALASALLCGGTFAQTITTPGSNVDLGPGWRTSTVPKMALEGNNVLGTDGYYVPFGAGPCLVGDLQVPTYIVANLQANTCPNSTQSIQMVTPGTGEYSGNGGYYSIDNPAIVPPGTGTITTGNLNRGSNGGLFQFTLTGTVPTIIRVGVMVDNNDGVGVNPSSVTLNCTSCSPVISGPVVATVSTGTPSFNDKVPDWIYFDITHGVAGQTYQVAEAIGISPTQGNNIATLGAISFDSAVANPPTISKAFSPTSIPSRWIVHGDPHAFQQ